MLEPHALVLDPRTVSVIKDPGRRSITLSSPGQWSRLFNLLSLFKSAPNHIWHSLEIEETI
jgi:hypothetical protein